LKAEIISLQRENTELTQNFEEKLSREKRDLETERKKYEQLNTISQTKIAELTREKETAEKQLQDAREDINATSDEVIALREQMASVHQAYELLSKINIQVLKKTS